MGIMLWKLLLTLSLLGLGVTLAIDMEGAFDCSKLPSQAELSQCCNYPELFKQNVMNLCDAKHSQRNQCFYDCVFESTEICRHRKCDNNKAVDYINWVMPEENVYSRIYMQAYADCIERAATLRNTMSQNDTGCDPVPELLYRCVQNEVFTSCPSNSWHDNDDCANKRKLVSHCQSVRQPML